jgi:hypothetical protein
MHEAIPFFLLGRGGVRITMMSPFPYTPNKKRARIAHPLTSINAVVEMNRWNVKGGRVYRQGCIHRMGIAMRTKGFAAQSPRQVSNSAQATWITLPSSLFIASSLLLFHFYFSIDIYNALRTTTITTKDERRRTNGKTPLHSILFFSCLPWLTITFYIIHLSFGFRFATTMTTITMTTTIMTTRQLLYIACKGSF